MSLSAMTDIIDPYHFTAGSAPLLISIPHAGTQLTPEVDNGLSDAARPLGDTDWHIPRLYDFAHALGARYAGRELFPFCYRPESPC